MPTTDNFMFYHPIVACHLTEFLFIVAYETCYNTDDYGASYTGFVNISDAGVCMDNSEAYGDHIR